MLRHKRRPNCFDNWNAVYHGVVVIGIKYNAMYKWYEYVGSVSRWVLDKMGETMLIPQRQ